MLANLYRFVVPAVADPPHLVHLGALSRASATSHARRVAAVRGRLQATRGSDGQWHSSRVWVQQYLDSRYQRLHLDQRGPGHWGTIPS